MEKIINIVQIIVAISVTVTILLQSRGSGAGAIFGGGGGVQYTRRGAEKFLHIATIVLLILFVLLGVASLIIQKS
jgi:preprotein translocase subunit SecG